MVMNCAEWSALRCGGVKNGVWERECSTAQWLKCKELWLLGVNKT